VKDTILINLEACDVIYYNYLKPRTIMTRQRSSSKVIIIIRLNPDKPLIVRGSYDNVEKVSANKI
jgi:hypothetical protein